MNQRNPRKEAFREAERKHGEENTLESGLILAKVMSRTGTPQETYRVLDKLHLEYGNALKEALTQPKLPETFSRYHEDITELADWEHDGFSLEIPRREAQALEAITKTGNAPSGHVTRHGRVYNLTFDDYGFDRPPEELCQLPELEGLTFNHGQLTTLQGLPNLPNLQRLVLDSNQLTTLQHLPKLPKLQSILIRRNQIPQQEIKELKERGVEVIY